MSSNSKKTGKRGRPTVITDDKKREILAVVATGGSRNTAADYVGIGRSTLYSSDHHDKGANQHMTGKAPEITQEQVDKLIPYARNSRTHSPGQIDKIAASILEFGFLNPVITDGAKGIIAGEMTGRCVHAIEINPAYVDVAIKRWQDFTGEQATLESTGKTFDEIKGEHDAA